MNRPLSLPCPAHDPEAIRFSAASIRDTRASIDRLMSRDPTVRDPVTRFDEIVSELELELEVGGLVA